MVNALYSVQRNSYWNWKKVLSYAKSVCMNAIILVIIRAKNIKFGMKYTVYSAQWNSHWNFEKFSIYGQVCLYERV